MKQLKIKRADGHLLEQWRAQNDLMRQQAQALQHHRE